MLAHMDFPVQHRSKTTAPTPSNASTRRSNAAPMSSASFQMRPQSSASSVPSCSNSTTSGSSSIATCRPSPWPNLHRQWSRRFHPRFPPQPNDPWPPQPTSKFHHVDGRDQCRRANGRDLSSPPTPQPHPTTRGWIVPLTRPKAAPDLFDAVPCSIHLAHMRGKSSTPVPVQAIRAQVSLIHKFERYHEENHEIRRSAKTFLCRAHTNLAGDAATGSYTAPYAVDTRFQ